MENNGDKKAFAKLLADYQVTPNPMNTLALMTALPKEKFYVVKKELTQHNGKDQWLTFTEENGNRLLQVFTSRDKIAGTIQAEGGKIEVTVVSFKKIALLVLAEGNPLQGFVVDPNHTNAVFNQNIIEKIWRYSLNHV